MAVVLMKGLTLALSVISACGHPFPIADILPWNCFDGKLFQHFYTRLVSGDTVEQLLQHKVSCVDMTNAMKDRYSKMKLGSNPAFIKPEDSEYL